jgi:hypothetical protein
MEQHGKDGRINRKMDTSWERKWLRKWVEHGLEVILQSSHVELGRELTVVVFHCKVPDPSSCPVFIRQDHRISRAEFSKGASREWVESGARGWKRLFHTVKHGFVWRNNCSEIQWLIVDALF